MEITTKRIYEQPLQSDGYRVLVDRLWPRGMSKENACINLWAKELAPSGDLRKWFGRRAQEKPLTGHHVGLYGSAFTYDFETGGRGFLGGEPGGDIYDRANFSAGVEYGYSLPIAERLNLDFTLGVGWVGGTYYEYLPIDDCYVWQSTHRLNYFGPTRLEISLVWLLGRGNYNQGY